MVPHVIRRSSGSPYTINHIRNAGLRSTLIQLPEVTNATTERPPMGETPYVGSEVALLAMTMGAYTLPNS